MNWKCYLRHDWETVNYASYSKLAECINKALPSLYKRTTSEEVRDFAILDNAAPLTIDRVCLRCGCKEYNRNKFISYMVKELAGIENKKRARQEKANKLWENNNG